MANQDRTTRARTLCNLKMLSIYEVLHERSNITTSFEEHLKLLEKLTFTYALWVSSSKLK